MSEKYNMKIVSNAQKMDWIFSFWLFIILLVFLFKPRINLCKDTLKDVSCYASEVAQYLRGWISKDSNIETPMKI
jgi:hypothetical protein